MRVVPYSESEAGAWEAMVAASPMATFLHTRRYLSYHGARFKDVSLLIMDERGALAGLFPAAVDNGNERRVVSHPGITYGGILHRGSLQGEKMLEALEAVRGHYREAGYESLRYKAVPYIYQRVPSGDDLYALFRLGALRYRCDLSSTIDLDERRTPSERRRRGLKKASKAGIEIRRGAEFIEPLWRVLEENLERKHGARPVHTAEEIARLGELFPEEIEFHVALLDGQVLAGVVLFVTQRVLHAQYIASSSAGYDTCALDALLEHCVEQARSRSLRYFDFGNSNEDEGRYLNTGLYQFKTEFGGGGVVHEFYELSV